MAAGYKCKQAGFTLIELLVVIAIIAILAAILFPVFVSAKAQARNAECLSRIKDLGTAYGLYIDAWDDTIPSGINGPQNGLIRKPLQDQLKRYLKVSKTHIGYTQPGVKEDTGIPVTFFCPSFLESWRGAHGWYFGAGTYEIIACDRIADDQYAAKKLSYCLALWNRWVGEGKTNTRVNPPKFGPSGAQLAHCIFGGQFTGIPGPEEYFYPHNNGVNVLYLDFHVKWHKDKSAVDRY